MTDQSGENLMTTVSALTAGSGPRSRARRGIRLKGEEAAEQSNRDLARLIESHATEAADIAKRLAPATEAATPAPEPVPTQPPAAEPVPAQPPAAEPAPVVAEAPTTPPPAPAAPAAAPAQPAAATAAPPPPPPATTSFWGPMITKAGIAAALLIAVFMFWPSSEDAPTSSAQAPAPAQNPAPAPVRTAPVARPTPITPPAATPPARSWSPTPAQPPQRPRDLVFPPSRLPTGERPSGPQRRGTWP